MAMVRSKEEQAERMAHLLDDVFRLPGTRIRLGIDPLVGLVPVIGDAIVTAWGAAIVVIARQLNVPWSVVAAMAYNVIKNGVVGAVPLAGDAYSFWFKSNARNAALLLRAVKRGEQGACRLVAQRLTLKDVLLLTLLIAPTLIVIFAISLWLWNHNISYFTVLFPPPYQSRTE